MREDQPSTTAENNAILKAIETLRPEDERICHDPFAKYFLPEQTKMVIHLDSERRKILHRWEGSVPGVCNAVLARTRFMDDCLTDAIEKGLGQVVIIGAGYDTRALRIKGLKGNATVFELGHPATQRTKIKRLKRALSSLPEHVKYIPVRLHKDDLAAKLNASGYDNHLKTFFIWEGVTYYIPLSTIAGILTFISKHSAKGSSVVFDYFPPSVADGTCKLKEAIRLRDGLKQMGEKIVFGIDPDKISTFLHNYGLHPVRNMNSKAFKKRHFKGPNTQRQVSEIFNFVYAMVT